MIKNYIAGVYLAFLCCGCSGATESRITEDFNFDWRFHYGDVENGFYIETNDDNWSEVRLPHDWSVEHSFTQENTGGATAFLPGGIGWYRKYFNIPTSYRDRKTCIQFDGVYTNSEVWINGHRLGERPFGYAPFSYDLTPHLNFGGENVIAVKADRSAFLDSRWYPGSGIYRNVKLVSYNKTHIPQWGVYITTPMVDSTRAKVNLNCKIIAENDVVLRSSIFLDGKVVDVATNELDVETAGEHNASISFEIINPKLWDTENANLYTAVTEVIVDGKICDKVSNRFGIRSFSFDAEKGFFLNGKNILIKGVCIHHDAGLVGAAVPRGVWERRLSKLKDAGCNAIRTAHNPPSEEFLDICDEMGFLVQDEAFDEFQNPKDKRKNYNQESEDEATRGYTHHFEEWAVSDLTNMVLRDRNHPSIIMWSIGNEIEWTFPDYGNATGYWGSTKVGDVNYYWDEPPYSIEKTKELFYASGKEDICAKTAKKLSGIVKKYDTTRPVTANLVIPTVSMFSGYADALDIVGLSYRQSVYDYCRRNYPDKIILGTENWARYHEWKPVVENDYMSGVFLWTGIDYMGESKSWPVRGSSSGLLDFAGFEKPSFHMFKSLWQDEPHIYITTQTLVKSPYTVSSIGEIVEKETNWAAHQKWGWQDVNTHWNYTDGDKVAIEVYTNQESVELFLNGKSYGVKHLADVTDHILKWIVPYQKGELKAVSVDNNVDYTVNTAMSATDFIVQVDRQELKADGYDVAHFEIQLTDENGQLVKHEEMEVNFEIEGPVKLLGVDNGSPSNVQDYQSKKIVTSKGKCLMIIQSTENVGSASINVRMGDVKKNIRINTI